MDPHQDPGRRRFKAKEENYSTEEIDVANSSVWQIGIKWVCSYSVGGGRPCEFTVDAVVVIGATEGLPLKIFIGSHTCRPTF